MSNSSLSNSVQISGPEENFGRTPAYESAVSLRFWSEELVPDEITHALGVQPQVSHAKDESLAPSLTPPAPVGLWIYFADESDDCLLAEQILRLLQRLPQELEIWHRLTTKYSGVLFCGLRFDQEHCGQFLPAETLEQIVQRGLAIDFDLKFDPAEPRT